MKIITKSEVEKYLTMPECIEVMRECMINVSKGKAHLPIRQFMPIPGADGKLAIMPGAMEDPHCFGIKLVCKYQREPDSPHGSHVGMVLLFDAKEGVPVAMIEGSSLTGIRTAAASAMATDLLARKDSTRLLILGCGDQARRHITAMRCVRDIESVVVWGRNAERAEAFASEAQEREGIPVTATDDVPEALKSADIVCTVTAASEPVLFGKDVMPGTHLNLVGSAVPTNREVDTECVKRSKYFVDYRPAALAAAGELLVAIEEGKVSEAHVVAEVGKVAASTGTGRDSYDDVTLYKSLGVAAQDLAAAEHLLVSSARNCFEESISLAV